MSALGEKVLNLPALPGVYLFKDPRGGVLYVGKAKSLAARVRSYLSGENSHPRLRELMAEAVDLDSILTDTEAEALLLEATLVRQHRPHYNVLLKDDKSFPYVRLSVQEEYPRLSVTRQVRSDGARYLGPYTDVKHLRRTLREVRRIFPVRTCRNFEDYRRANRPCLYYHIRRCAGPCATRAGVTPASYRAIVDGLLLFLTGRDAELLHALRERMEQASAAHRYEEAARLRDQIRHAREGAGATEGREPGGPRHRRAGARAPSAGAPRWPCCCCGPAASWARRRACSTGPTRWTTRPCSSSSWRSTTSPARPCRRGSSWPSRRPTAEVTLEALSARAGHRVELRVPRRGRARALLLTAERNAAHALEDLAARSAGRRSRFSPEMLELQKALALAEPPWRMVCFDVSNLGAESAVAAVVAAENGRARTGLYRRMRVRRPGPDDFAMIGEAVERYWTRVESGEEPRPDLVMVDGGAGQVTAARAALDRVATRPVPLIGLAKREETVVRESGAPLTLPRRSPALRALQRLRDEAHRFGLTYHRKLRGRARLTSALDRVPGVGPARRAALLKAFGSVAALAGAEPEEIARRAGVPPALAGRVAAQRGAAGARAAGGATAAGPAGESLRRPA